MICAIERAEFPKYGFRRTNKRTFVGFELDFAWNTTCSTTTCYQITANKQTRAQ